MPTLELKSTVMMTPMSHLFLESSLLALALLHLRNVMVLLCGVLLLLPLLLVLSSLILSLFLFLPRKLQANNLDHFIGRI